MTAICACKRQVLRSVSQPEHIRVASLTSAELRHSVEQETSLMLESYTQSNLLAPSVVCLQTTSLSYSFMA